jgi:phosphoglycolate phosphatase
MLLAALAETGADPARAVMVGDTEYDIEMGRAAGFRTLGVAWGYHPHARLSRADAILSDWRGLPAALDRLWGAP